jgi:hypothetical protein
VSDSVRHPFAVDCVGQKKHWRAGDNVCVRIQVLRIACATIDDTAIPGTWAPVEFATKYGAILVGCFVL